MKCFHKTELVRKFIALLLTAAIFLPVLSTAASAEGIDNTNYGHDLLNAGTSDNGVINIMALETLADDVLTQNYPLGSLRLISEIDLPSGLWGYDDCGEPVFIAGIKWYCPEFDPYEEGVYLFLPLLPDEFAWTEESEVQVILVHIYVPETGGGYQAYQASPLSAGIMAAAAVDVTALVAEITRSHNSPTILQTAVTEEDGITVVTVTGSASNIYPGWDLDIPYGVLVRWKATVSSPNDMIDLITAGGYGTLEIAEGSQISFSGDGISTSRVAAVRLKTDCIISGGTISCNSTTAYPYAVPIIVDNAFITLDISGGTFSASGQYASVIFVNSNNQGSIVSIRGGTFSNTVSGGRALRWDSNNLPGNFSLYCGNVGSNFNGIKDSGNGVIFSAFDNTDKTTVTYYYNSLLDYADEYITNSSFPGTVVDLVDIAGKIVLHNATVSQFLTSNTTTLDTIHTGTYAGPIRLDPPAYLPITGVSFSGWIPPDGIEVLQDNSTQYYISGSGDFSSVNLTIDTLLLGKVPVEIPLSPAIHLNKWTLPDSYVNMSPNRTSATYNGTSQGVSVLSNPHPFDSNIPDRNGLLNSFTYSYQGVSPTNYGPSSTAPTNAGAYTVSVNYANMHITGTKTFNYTINKRSLAGNQPTVGAEAEDTVSFDLSELLPDITSPETYASVAYTLGTIEDADEILRSAGIVGTDLFVDIFDTAQNGQSATIPIIITSANHDITNASVTFTVTANQIPVSISAQMSGGVYKAEPYNFTDTPVFRRTDDNSAVPLGASEYTVAYLYSADSGATYLPLSPNEAPKDAGYYAVEIATAATSSYFGSSRIAYRITRAELTATADNKEIDQYELVLPAASVSYSGFQGMDNAAGVFSTLPVAEHSVTHAEASGEFPIRFSEPGVLNGATGANYTLIHRVGTLTVKAAQRPGTIDFQLVAISPRQIFAGKTEKTLTFYGSGMDKAAGIEFTYGTTTTSVRIEGSAFTALRRLGDGNSSLSVDLAKTNILNNFGATGVYYVKLLFGDVPVASAEKSFSIEEKSNFTPNSYGILRISQLSDGTFRAETFEGEAEMIAAPASGKQLITIRGEITADGGGYYTVKGNAVINRTLTYSGKDFDVQVSDGRVVVESDNTITNILKWQGVPVLVSGFSIALNSGDPYKLNRLDDVDGGVDMLIYSKALTNRIYLYAFAAEANAIKLYEKEFSVSGKVDLKAAIPTIDLGANVSAELHDMLLGEKTGLPPMHISAEAGLDAEGTLGKLIGGGFKLEFELDTMPETYPSFAKLTGEMDINDVFHLEGELVFTWADGLYIPEKLDLFARVEEGGVPLVPPIIVAYINGFGGGIDGLSRTVRGQYGMIPPLTINAKGAIKDVSGAIFEISKATITLGPSQISVVANEGKLLKVIKLTDVGFSMGFMDPNPSANIPDIYFNAKGEFGFDWKVISMKGKIDLSAYFRGYYMENTASDVWNILKKLNPAKFDARSISTADLNSLLNNLIMMVDLEGSFRGEISVDIFIVGAEVWAELGFSKMGRNIKLSGGVGVEGFILGESIGTYSITVVWDVTNNDISVSRARAAAVDEPGYLVETRVSEDATERLYITNISPVGALSLGGSAANPLLRMVQPNSLYIGNDLPHGVNLSSSGNTAEIIVTSPAGGLFDDLDFGELKSGETVHGFVSNAGTQEAPQKLLTLADGTKYLELDKYSYKISPAWQWNDESGSYEAGFLLKGQGYWSFATADSGDYVSLTLLQIDPIPSLINDSLVVSRVSGADYTAGWDYDYDSTGVSAENLIPEEELEVKLHLVNADNEEIICDLGVNASPADGYAAFTMPYALDSGSYKIKALLYRTKNPSQPSECLSIVTSDTFAFINPMAPGTVSGVAAAYTGDGAFKVRWNKVNNADGYSIAIFEKNGGDYSPIPGIGEIIVRDAEEVVISGGMVETYVIDTDTGIKESALCGIEFGKDYAIEVRAFKEIILPFQNDPDDEWESADTSIYIYGQPDTGGLYLQAPVPPSLGVSIPGAKEILTHENGITSVLYALNAATAGNAIAAITSDAAKINVYLNGNEIDTSLYPAIPLNFSEDGYYTLLVAAESSQGDTYETILNIMVKTSLPEIYVDESSFFGHNGGITISGIVEIGSELEIDGVGWPVESGLFSQRRNSDMLHTPVKLTATDIAGNVSERILDILMWDAIMLPLTKIALSLEHGADQDGKYVLNKKSPPVGIELWGIFGENGDTKYLLDRTEADLETIYNTGGITPNTDDWTVSSGDVESGAAVLMASYIMDDSSTLYGALNISVGNAPVNTYVMTLQSQSGGQIISPVTGGSYEAGTVISLSANPDVGYVFVGWLSTNGGVFGDHADSSTTFKMPANPTTVYASFSLAAAEKYALTLAADSGGWISKGNGGDYLPGAQISLNAAASEGYIFKEWTSSNGGTFSVANSAAATFTMPASATVVTATFEKIPANDEYWLRLRIPANGQITQGYSGFYKEGETVDLTAVPDTGYIFTGWTSDGGVFSNSASATTAFTMPAREVTVEAHFTRIATYTVTTTTTYYTVKFDLNGGTRTGGGALTQFVSSGGAATMPAVTRDGYTFEGWDKPVNGITSDTTVTAQWKQISGGLYLDEYGIKIPVTIDADGILKLNLTKGEAEKIIAACLDGHIVFDFSIFAPINGADFDFDPAWFNVPGVKSLTLKLKDIGGVTFDKGAIAKLADIKKTLRLTVRKGSLVFDILTAADGKSIGWYDYENPILITLPVTGANFVMKDAEKIIPRSWATDNTLYGLVYTAGKYEAVSATPINFTDTAGKWMDAPAKYMSARGVIAGIGNNLFAPERDVTRGEFVTMLMRALAIEPQGAWMTQQFSDVEDGKFYYDITLKAKALGIVAGIGDNKFAPESNITRQDMFLMLYNAMTKLGFITPVADTDIEKYFARFKDADQISDYAKKATATFIKAGIAAGKGGGILDPKGTATRTEAAQIIYNMLQDDIKRAADTKLPFVTVTPSVQMDIYIDKSVLKAIENALKPEEDSTESKTQ